MRVGVSLTSNHPDVTDPRQGARWMIERAAAARRAALDSLFVGDQHVSATPYYQNTPMLGRLLAEWGEAPAGCLFLLPLWHPVLVAEQIGTLAAIARGPFIMQCGLGWGDDRFAAMGANIRTRPSAFEEALDMGLVHYIYERENFMEQVMDYARQFIVPNKSSLAVGKVKRAIQTGLELSLPDGLAFERELLAQAFGSEDGQEGVKAYLEKRTAQFKGK